MRIIDRDIELYVTSAEAHQSEILRCVLGDEPKYAKLRDAAMAVTAALREYRAALAVANYTPLEP